jgi:hypothetical protein
LRSGSAMNNSMMVKPRSGATMYSTASELPLNASPATPRMVEADMKSPAIASPFCVPVIELPAA